MQVHRDEDVASRIGPESCAGPREGVGEALTGERAGQPLSRESNTIRAPTLSHWRKAIRTAAIARVAARPCVVIEPGMHESSLHGKPGDLWLGHLAPGDGPHREGEEP